MAKPPPSMPAALVASPVLTLFLVIGPGYLAGELNVSGFRLGVAGVLFAGLACGSISPAWHCPNWWLRSGSSFSYTPSAFNPDPRFSPLSGARERAIVCSPPVASLWAPGPRRASLSSSTSTPPAPPDSSAARSPTPPALAAARERLRATGGPAGDVTVASSVAYPFGVGGALICIQIARRLFASVPEAPPEVGEILVRDCAVKK
jgi:putative transport protein